MPLNTDPVAAPAPGPVQVQAAIATTWIAATDGPRGACIRPLLPPGVVAWVDTSGVLKPKAGDPCAGVIATSDAAALKNAQTAGTLTIAAKDQPAVDAAASASTSTTQAAPA